MTKRHLLLRKWGKATTKFPSNPRPVGEIAQEFLKIALQNAQEIEEAKNKLIKNQPNALLKRMIFDAANELKQNLNDSK